MQTIDLTTPEPFALPCGLHGISKRLRTKPGDVQLWGKKKDGWAESQPRRVLNGTIVGAAGQINCYQCTEKTIVGHWSTEGSLSNTKVDDHASQVWKMGGQNEHKLGNAGYPIRDVSLIG